jgi:uncharacterized membrane protein YidH (DUF202 family)
MRGIALAILSHLSWFQLKQAWEDRATHGIKQAWLMITWCLIIASLACIILGV